MSRPARRPGLYWQLTLRLLLPMSLIIIVGSVLGYSATKNETAAVFDRWLLDAAVSLADQVQGDGRTVRVDLPPAAAAMLVYDEIDEVHFEVLASGRVLAGQAGIPLSGRNEAHYRAGDAYDATFLGNAVRVAVTRPACEGCERVTVLVTETTRKRRGAERRQLWFLAPMGLLLAATALAIFVAVQRTVRPLEALAEHWNRESHASLQKIPEGDLPRELAPFETALNDLLERLRAMLVRERQFAATAAHQLRTPLTALRLGLDRARAEPDVAGMRAVLGELEASTQRTARLVQQLLLLGRVDPESRAGIDRLPLDLVGASRDVCAVRAEVALAKDVELALLDPGRPVVVCGQAELLAECVMNLLDNALHAAPPRGQVRITVADGPPSLRIEDSGPGLTPEEREHVFERFVRGSRVEWPGSGLGLAIVSDIAMLHGARIQVGESALGGARFDLVFPEPAARPAA